MTKRIRIENADCNKTHRVQVHHQDLTVDGWKTVKSEEIFITQLMEITIHGSKRIIVAEMISGPQEETR